MTATEPRSGLTGEAAHHAAYLDFYRRLVVERAGALPDAERRRPVLPSGWTVLELLHHLWAMERRWFVWGFLGEAVDGPWRDSGDAPDGRWTVPAGTTYDDLVAALERQGGRTREVLAAHPLEARAATTGRFAGGGEVPDLRWTCFHVLQEYARHAGHLDVVSELLGGPTGE